MATPPTYVSQYGVAASTTNAAKTTASFNATANDVLIAIVFAENSASTSKPGAISNTQGALTWTTQGEWDTGADQNAPYIKVYSTVVDANKTGMTVSVADNSGNGRYWGLDVIHYTASAGVGTTNIVNNGTGSGAPSVSITPTGANSAAVFGICDWNAVSGARTYNTTNGTYPSERYYANNTTYATFIAASHADSGSITSRTYSLSSPSTMRYAICVVEVLGTSSGTQTITCQAITASSTLYNPTVINTQEIVFNVLDATSTILSPTIINTQEIFLDVLATASTVFNSALIYKALLEVLNTSSTVYNPTLDYNVLLDVINASTTIFDPIISQGAVTQTVVTPLIATTGVVLDPGSEMILQLDVTNTTSSIYSPALDYNVELSVLNTSVNVLQPALIDNAELQLLTTTSTIFDPTLNQDVNIPVLSATENVLSPQIQNAGGAQVITYDFIATSTTLFAPTTFTTISVPVINVPGTVESPSTKYVVGLQVVTTSSNIFTPSLEYLIELQTVNTAPTVLAPRIGEPPPDTGQYGIVKTNSPSPFPIGI